MEITSVQPFSLDLNFIAHTRKNHAMEHATIQMLAKRKPNQRFSGYSIHKGFWILGDAELQDVQKAAEIALAKLQNGDKELAVHPNCGTNLGVTGLCVAAAGLLTTKGLDKDDSLAERITALTAAGMLGTLAGRYLGPNVQAYVTTDANVQDLAIESITLGHLRDKPAFFVKTRLEI